MMDQFNYDRLGSLRERVREQLHLLLRGMYAGQSIIVSSSRSWRQEADPSLPN